MALLSSRAFPHLPLEGHQFFTDASVLASGHKETLLRRYLDGFTTFRAYAREETDNGRHDFMHTSHNRNMPTAVINRQHRVWRGAMHGLAKPKRGHHVVFAPHNQ